MKAGDNGKLTITGGTIQNNIATDVGAGGVNGETEGCLIISGNPVITGNTAKGAANNVRMKKDYKITIDGAIGGSIGVTVLDENDESGMGVFTSGLSGNGDISCFISDNENYVVVLNESNEAEVSIAPVASVTIDGDNEV